MFHVPAPRVQHGASHLYPVKDVRLFKRYRRLQRQCVVTGASMLWFERGVTNLPQILL